MPDWATPTVPRELIEIRAFRAFCTWVAVAAKGSAGVVFNEVLVPLPNCKENEPVEPLIVTCCTDEALTPRPLAFWMLRMPALTATLPVKVFPGVTLRTPVPVSTKAPVKVAMSTPAVPATVMVNVVLLSSQDRYAVGGGIEAKSISEQIRQAGDNVGCRANGAIISNVRRRAGHSPIVVSQREMYLGWRRSSGQRHGARIKVTGRNGGDIGQQGRACILARGGRAINFVARGTCDGVPHQVGLEVAPVGLTLNSLLAKDSPELLRAVTT